MVLVIHALTKIIYCPAVLNLKFTTQSNFAWLVQTFKFVFKIASIIRIVFPNHSVPNVLQASKILVIHTITLNVSHRALISLKIAIKQTLLETALNVSIVKLALLRTIRKIYAGKDLQLKIVQQLLMAYA